MDAKTIIDSVASGKALEAKEGVNSLLSARAFEALDAKKIELAQALFSTTDQIENEEEISKEEVEQIDELSKEREAQAWARRLKPHSFPVHDANDPRAAVERRAFRIRDMQDAVARDRQRAAEKQTAEK